MKQGFQTEPTDIYVEEEKLKNEFKKLFLDNVL